MSESAQAFHARAMAAEQAGDPASARAIMADGIAAHPTSAELKNSAGSLAMRAGSASDAETLFAQALALQPANLEFAINRAIALGQLERYGDACALLGEYETQGASQARYWSVRGASERGARRMTMSQSSYEKCLARDPRHPRALHAMARIALERGAPDAVQRFDSAIAVNPGDPGLWLGKAQALDVAGDTQGARTIMQQIAEQAPGYTDGLAFLAQLRLAAGEDDFCSHYREAAERHRADPNIPYAHVEALSGLDRNAEAAEVAAEARRQFPDQPAFALLEAIHAGTSGDDARAEAIYQSLTLATRDRHVHEARHRIRRGELDRADENLKKALLMEPWDIGAWALRGMAWRLADDARAHWLHGQDGLVQRLPLRGQEDLLARSVAFLRDLHAESPFPLGQSLRGGTQTRGILFDRAEPLLTELHEAIRATIEDYQSGLPARDDTHPLLRHRDRELRLEGSWSVRLTGGGDYHTSHIHPQGILSSALYLVVPDDAADEVAQSGWLEVGRPPPDLRLDLPAVETIRPEPGFLALFPSYLYHGTTPFGDAERMTVAFDVVPVAGTSA